MLEQLPNFQVESLYDLAFKLIRAICILIAALVLTKFIRRIIGPVRAHVLRVMMKHDGGTESELEKRAETIVGIIGKAAAVGLWVVAGILVLAEAGFDVSPLLAGAGIFGLAAGFGAQHLVRDVIAGLFILIENQIRVNDIAAIDGVSGTVEEINLRTTVLRSLDGSVHIFPNGSIGRLSNRTRDFSYYVFDIGVAYREDTDRVIEVMRGAADELMGEEAYRKLILEPMEFLGVDKFADSAVVIKARIKTLPTKHMVVGREMNRRIKKRFEEAGIEIPFPHQTLQFGQAGRPFRVQLEPGHREELKQAVREVLAEHYGQRESDSRH